MSRGQQFRELLRRGGVTIAPGAYDCITARSIAQAGFGAVYMTGAGTAATLGYPDYGLLTMSEMADNADRIAACVDVKFNWRNWAAFRASGLEDRHVGDCGPDRDARF